MATPTTFGDYKVVVTNINRMEDGQRIVPMKVLLLGMPRTATECESSFAIRCSNCPPKTCNLTFIPPAITNGLKFLGISPIYHGWQTIFDNPRDNQWWLQAIEAKFDGKGTPYGRQEFDKLLGHCQGASDLPAILFAKELIEAYPEAKIILTHRNFDTWYKSCFDTIHTRVLHPLSKSLIPITFALDMHSKWTRPCWIRAWNTLTRHDFSKENARKVYDEHYQLVREIVAQQPKDQNNSKLLEYNVKEDWDPLCKFLGVEHPGIEFPRGNQASVFVKRFEKALLVTLSAILLRLGVLAGGVGFVWFVCRWLLRR